MIPDEAVAAAMSAWLDRSKVPGSWSLEEEVRAALEAAAPHLIAGALYRAADAFEAQPPQLRNGHVSALRLYAAEPWRLETCPSECATKHPGKEHAD